MLLGLSVLANLLTPLVPEEWTREYAPWLWLTSFVLFAASTAILYIDWRHRRDSEEVELKNELRFAADILPLHDSHRIESGLSPSALLNPDRRIVPFRGYAAQLREVLDWCLRDDSVAVFAVCGPAFIGKTRISSEVASKLPPNWVTLRINFNNYQDALRITIKLENVLFVADLTGGDQRAASFLDDFSSLARDPTRQVRCLILSRAHHAVIPTMLNVNLATQELLETALNEGNYCELAAIGQKSDIQRWTSEALIAFGRHSGQSVLPDIRLDLPAGTSLGLIHAHTLAALLKAADSPPSHSSVWEFLATVESDSWPIFPGRTTTGDIAMRTFAALWLSQTTTRQEAVRVLQSLPEFSDASAERLHEVVSWSTHLYTESRAEADRPYLDEFRSPAAYAVVAKCLREDPHFVQTVVKGLPIVRTAWALTSCITAENLVGADARTSEALLASISEFFSTETFATMILTGGTEASMDVALSVQILDAPPELDSSSEMIRNISERTTRLPLTHFVLHQQQLEAMFDSCLSSSMWQTSIHCADLLVTAGLPAGALFQLESAVAVQRAAMGEDQPSGASEFGTVLTDAARIASEVGAERLALDLATEAVEVLRVLHLSRPDEHWQSLCKALIILAVQQSRLVSVRDSLFTAEEAMEVFQACAGNDPSLTWLHVQVMECCAAALRAVGRRTDGLELQREAISVGRATSNHATTSLSSFGASLSNFARALYDTDSWAEALVVVDESLRIWRKLSVLDAMRYTPLIASSLRLRGQVLARLGRNSEALGEVSRAVSMFRGLPGEVATTSAEYAMALSSMTSILIDIGRPLDALPSSKEAVEVYRGRMLLGSADEIMLSSALGLHSFALSQLQQHDGAVLASSEAVSIMRQTAEPQMLNSQEGLAYSLNVHGVTLQLAGRHLPALAAFQEASEISAALAAADSRAFGDLHSVIEGNLALSRRGKVDPDPLFLPY